MLLFWLNRTPTQRSRAHMTYRGKLFVVIISERVSLLSLIPSTSPSVAVWSFLHHVPCNFQNLGMIIAVQPNSFDRRDSASLLVYQHQYIRLSRENGPAWWWANDCLLSCPQVLLDSDVNNSCLSPDQGDVEKKKSCGWEVCLGCLICFFLAYWVSGRQVWKIPWMSDQVSSDTVLND
jgi:hypothetical protein